MEIKTVEIFLADNSQIYLEGVKLLLQPNKHICIVGEATTVCEAITKISQKVPKIVMLDISLETETDGISLVQMLKKDFPAIKIIFLTHNKTTAYMIKALQTGACAYLRKNIKPTELINAINAVSQENGVYLGNTIPVADLLKVFGSQQNILKNKAYDLTLREIKIIELLAQGLSTKNIAENLGVGASTIESHKERIKEKMNVKTIMQIVIFAVKKGIINLED
jgi:two-component system response regulator NreC